MNRCIEQNRARPGFIVIALCTFLALTLLSPLSTAQAESSSQEANFSEAELAQMLAPIALYPDSLLTHILIASTYPLEVVQAKRLQENNTLLPADQLIDKANNEEWDPSVTALLAFPTVLEKLSEDLAWTQDLGDAFLQDEQQVLTSIQVLRQQADDANSLNEMENMEVSRVDNQIIIEPVQKEIVYVPYYDPRVVYGHWAWYNYPPVYWTPHPYYVRPPYGHFYYHRGVHISFNYYFSAFHWHKRHVVVVHHKNARHYRHHGRIVTSSGAQRWNHKPAHRRGVAYRSPVVKQRYNSHRPSTFQSKQVRQAEHNKITHANTKARINGKPSNNKQTNNLSHYNKQVTKQREKKFANQMHKSRDMQVNDRSMSNNHVKQRPANMQEQNRSKVSNNQQRTQPKPQVRPSQPVNRAQPQLSQPRQPQNRQPQARVNSNQHHKASGQDVRSQQHRAQPARQASQPSQMRSSGQSHSKSQSHNSSKPSHNKQRD